MLPKLMLAATARSVDEVLCQPGTWLMTKKHNGIRAIMWHGQLLSRTLKTFPNFRLNSQAEALYAQGSLCHGDEIELILRDLGGPDLPLEDIQSVVMSRSKPFGDTITTGHFVVWGRYGEQVGTFNPAQLLAKGVELVLPETLLGQHEPSRDLALQRYKEVTESGGEGLIFRKMEAGYKHGRSTLKGGEMVKVKPLLDDEYRIVGMVEEVSKDGVPKDSLGALELCCVGPDGESHRFSVGSGFTAEQRKGFWGKDLLGHRANISFASRFAKTGVPQFPVFNYIRELV